MVGQQLQIPAIPFPLDHKSPKQTLTDIKLNVFTLVKQDCCLLSFRLHEWDDNVGSDHCCQGCSVYSLLRYFLLLLQTFSPGVCTAPAASQWIH